MKFLDLQVLYYTSNQNLVLTKILFFNGELKQNTKFRENFKYNNLMFLEGMNVQSFQSKFTWLWACQTHLLIIDLARIVFIFGERC